MAKSNSATTSIDDARIEGSWQAVRLADTIPAMAVGASTTHAQRFPENAHGDSGAKSSKRRYLPSNPDGEHEQGPTEISRIIPAPPPQAKAENRDIRAKCIHTLNSIES